MKLIQVSYQVYYRFRNKLSKSSISRFPGHKLDALSFEQGIDSADIYQKDNTFTFLNKEKSFGDSINWNYAENGKLWAYNLNYFEWLTQKGFTKEQGLRLISDFCLKGSSHKDGYEPYPISLRAINWVKFLSEHRIEDAAINQQLFSDLYRLKGQIEYHILANHLFENGFGMLFGAYYFKDEKLYKCAYKIISSQLKEQLLSDGAHYEVSPMYHHIILYRILDAYNLVNNNPWKQGELKVPLRNAAESMLGWLQEITFRDGSMPMLNDSAPFITPTFKELKEYAVQLGIQPKTVVLGESGYRKWDVDGMECIMDVGQISPSYQPGHSHADSLQFLLQHNNIPIIVDTGISTYEKNDRRQLERSTSSHNTVTVNGQNSSQVWSGFRVGQRARVQIIEENENCIEASHDGYRNMGIKHIRRFEKGNELAISDTVTNRQGKSYECKGHLHFHPDVTIEEKENLLIVNGNIFFTFENIKNLELVDYQMANGYNQLISAKKAIYSFKGTTKLIVSNVMRA